MEAFKKTVTFFDELTALSLAAAELLCKEANKSVAARGRFSLALSGGNTPREFYQLLSQSRFSGHFPWGKTDFFWSDERCVSPNHADSNYHLAFRTFLSKNIIPLERVHRILAEKPDSDTVAREYEDILRKFFDFKNPAQPEMTPSFDLTILGIGPDGHTASIFPKSEALEEKKRWVVSTPAPEGILPRVPRITLTLPLLNRSRKILFLASLEGKEKVLSNILEAKAVNISYPAAQVKALEEVLLYIQGKPLS